MLEPPDEPEPLDELPDDELPPDGRSSELLSDELADEEETTLTLPAETPLTALRDTVDTLPTDEPCAALTRAPASEMRRLDACPCRLFTQGNLCLFRKLCGEDERAHLARYRKGGLGFEGKAAGLAGSFHHLYGDPAHLAAGQANLAVRQRDLPDCHAAAQEQ